MAVRVNLEVLLEKAYEDLPLTAILDAPVAALTGVSDSDAEVLRAAFNIKTMRDLGTNKYFRAAAVLLDLAKSVKPDESEVSPPSVVMPQPPTATEMEIQLILPQAFLEAVGGPDGVAQLIGVATLELGRVAEDSAVARRLRDVTRVVLAATEIWHEEVVLTWLRSPNGYLGGARPINVIVLEGPSEVLDVLDAAASGAFA